MESEAQSGPSRQSRTSWKATPRLLRNDASKRSHDMRRWPVQLLLYASIYLHISVTNNCTCLQQTGVTSDTYSGRRLKGRESTHSSTTGELRSHVSWSPAHFLTTFYQMDSLMVCRFAYCKKEHWGRTLSALVHII